MTDLYAVLQVDRRAEPEVVRAAFRALAQKYHPDSGGDPGRLIAIVEAWSILGDLRRRANYDEGLAGRATPPQTRPAEPERRRSVGDPVFAAAATPAATPSGYGGPATSSAPAASTATTFAHVATAAPSASQRAAAASAAPPEPGSPGAATSPPPPDRRRTDGPTLDFGRYAGWTIGQLARHDPNYLEWLRRTPIGRPFTADIERVLDAGAGVAVATPLSSRGWQSRRPG